MDRVRVNRNLLQVVARVGLLGFAVSAGGWSFAPALQSERPSAPLAPRSAERESAPLSPPATIETAEAEVRPASPLLAAALDDHSCPHCRPECFAGKGHVCMDFALASAAEPEPATPGGTSGDPAICHRPCGPDSPVSAPLVPSHLRYVLPAASVAAVPSAGAVSLAAADSEPISPSFAPPVPPPRLRG